MSKGAASVPPSPVRLGGHVFLALAALALTQGLWISLGAAILFGLSPVEALARGAALFGVLSLVIGASVAEVIRRTGALYRAIIRSRTVGSVPPSQAALRDASSAPSWLGLVVCAPALLSALGDAVSGGALWQVAPSRALAFDAFVLAAGLWAVAPAVAIVRKSMGSWLAFPPQDQVVERNQPRAATPLLEATLPIVAVALACASVVDAVATDWPAVALGWAGGLAVTLYAVILGARMQRSLWEDTRALVLCIREASARLPQEGPGSIDLARGRYRTREIAEVAEEVEAMTVRYEGGARTEERARESVQELQRSKMLFMASMSHDLRSPLNSILGFSELLQQGGEGELDAAQRESVRLIARSGEELLRLLEDVLDSARFEAGRLQLRRGWTPSVEILTDAVQQGRSAVEDGNLEIVAELQPGLPPVHVDRDRIVQAVVGLLRHAARAMPGGTIRMYARVAADPSGGGQQLRVDVVDRKGSIREQDREKIFEAFREITSTTGRRIGGLGLTLSLSRALVRAHGGDVWIESRPGEGTTFTVAIPLEAGEELPERAAHWGMTPPK